MQELEEGVLAIDAFAAPEDAAGVAGNGFAGLGYAFAVAFHVELLQVRGQVAQQVGVGDDGMGLRAVEVVVPDADEAEDGGEVAAQRGGEEVFVHRVPAGEEGAEVFGADGGHQGQADGRPDGVTPAHAFGHGEAVFGGDAEGGGGFGVGGHGGEVARQLVFAHAALAQPVAGGVGVEQGFGGGETFAGEGKQGAAEVEAGEGGGEFRAVGVGGEMHAQAGVVGGEGGGGHARAEVGAADADVDQIGKRQAVCIGVCAADEAVGEIEGAFAFAPYFGQDVFAGRADRRGVGRQAQGGVQGGAAFAGVDGFAAPHGLHFLRQAGGFGQGNQQGEGVFADAVFAVIGQEAVYLPVHAREAIGLGGEAVADADARRIAAVSCECLPGGGLGDVGHRVFRAKGRDYIGMRGGGKLCLGCVDRPEAVKAV